jgi:transmembrane protein DUF3566
VSASDGAEKRGEAGAGAAAPADVTAPHAFGAEGDASRDRLRKPEQAGSWSGNDGRETAAVDQHPTSAYAPPPSYGSGVPVGAGAPVGSGAAGSFGGYGPTPPHVAPAPLAPPSVAASSRSAAAARRARLKIAHMGPLSVLRISLTFSLCMFVVLLVAVAALWGVLDTSGVFKSIVNAATTLTSNRDTIAQWLTFGRVMLITVVLGAANVIAFTLLATIGALLYNLCSDFVGGVEVTLVER